MERAAPPLAVGAPDPAPSPDRPPRARRWSRRTWAIAAVGVLVVAIGLAAAFLRDGGPAPITTADVDRAVKEGIERAQQDERNAPPDGATAYRTILPSLVTVTTEQGAGTTAVALGAGTIVNESGAVLTALHVVQPEAPAGGGAAPPAGRIRVRFADGTQATAQITSKDEPNDIAVLSVDRLPEIVVPAVLGGGVEVGDPVFPVGNPLGLTRTLTAGVVSAVDRSIRTDGERTLEKLIQFDAAVNPGNSGGPLLNRDGQLVGVVTGLANPSKQSYFVGIGFAVPIATAAGGAGGPQQ